LSAAGISISDFRGRSSGQAVFYPHRSGNSHEDTFNIQTRKFLKKVGIGAQRAIESSVRDAIQNGKLQGNEKLQAKVVLELPETELSIVIEDEIALE